MAVKKHLKNSEGQALFEMLAFMPILILLYTIIFNVGNSINVAINQQKVARRYFYYLVKGNSLLPTQAELMEYKSGFTQLGISMVGYADQIESSGSGGGQPYGSCFKFNSFAAGDSDETCKEPGDEEGESLFVRVFTVYGICGENFFRSGNSWIPAYTNGPGNPDPKSKSFACRASSNGP